MKLEVRDARAGDLPEVKRLIDEYIAVDYYSLEELEALLHGDQNLFYVVTDADRSNAIVSYFYAFLSGLDEALEKLHVRQKPEALLEYGPDTPVGVYKTSSTAADYQKHGICSSFISGLEPTFRKRGAKMLLATALKPIGQGVPMEHIFLKHGFTAIAQVSRPWVDMLLYCPYCNRNHCICDAVFYMKRLDETEGGELV
ncbi:MAG: hypothetical protein IJH38_07395 [Clostridia bacterium]|nr:hypothetical protein [Clostridia bacterium]